MLRDPYLSSADLSLQKRIPHRSTPSAHWTPVTSPSLCVDYMLYTIPRILFTVPHPSNKYYSKERSSTPPIADYLYPIVDLVKYLQSISRQSLFANLLSRATFCFSSSVRLPGYSFSTAARYSTIDRWYSRSSLTSCIPAFCFKS